MTRKAPTKPCPGCDVRTPNALKKCRSCGHVFYKHGRGPSLVKLTNGHTILWKRKPSPTGIS